jgi:uncharacterized protein (UPF0297 family)
VPQAPGRFNTIAEVIMLEHNEAHMTSTKDMLASALRFMKRRIFTGGYARPVHRFLSLLHDVHSVLPKGKYAVNVSFDLEYAYNTPFWTNEFHTALEYGRTAHEHVGPVCAFLNDRGIEYNVQVVGMLLETDPTDVPYLDEAKRACIDTNRELFTLPQEHALYLRAPSVDVGLHGYSHRLMNTLSREEVESEFTSAQTAFTSYFGDTIPPPTFMSFPRNKVGHIDVLREHGIQSWRTNRHRTEQTEEIPLGLWFAPGTLGVHDLRKVLQYIKSTKESFFLHLWSHFTEMDKNTFVEHVTMIEEEGWDFINVRTLRERYG